MTNLIQEGIQVATHAFRNFRAAFPTLDVRFYQNDNSLSDFLNEELHGAAIVIIHEWNAPAVVESILSLKRKLGFKALLHDTHHRAYTNPKEILRFPLSTFDGVLAFGQAIQQIYSQAFGVRRTWTFHEAADTARFYPVEVAKDTDVVWIGNWGDEERTQDLEEFLRTPASSLRDYRFAV